MPRRSPPETTAEECMESMVRRIVRDFDPLQVLLFGSRARGTARPDSDIDLIVVFAAVSNADRMTVAIRKCLREAAYSKDVIVTTPEDIERRRRLLGDVLHYAMPEARVLYERAA